MSIFDLYLNYSESQKDASMLETLLEKAQSRVNEAFTNIYHCFNESSDDVWRDISQKEVLKYCELDPESEVFWIKGVYEGADHPLTISLADLKGRQPDFFTVSDTIVIEVIVADNFNKIEQLKYDIKQGKDLFLSNNVHFVVKRDKNISDYCYKGGIAIQFEFGSNEIPREDDNSCTTPETDEVVLNGISSKDMVNFIREVVKEYIKQNPGITLSELQKAFAPIYNGRIYKFVEEKALIEELAKIGDVYHSLAYSGKLDDGTEYVIYKELLSYRHLPKVIEFAKKHHLL